MKKTRLLLLLALLMTAATGAMAQTETPSVKKLTVPDTWTGDMTVFSAADLPSDFAAVGDDVVATIPAPTATGNAVLIYGFSGGETKYVEYANGVQSATDSRDFPRDQIYGYVNIMGYEGVYYTAAAGTSATYSVKMKDGVKDADKWTISPNPAPEGSPVTATYSGEKKVKSVKAVKKAADPQAVPLTIEAITPGIISISNPKEGMQYSKNGGAKTAATTSIDVAAGDKVQFYGNGTSITSYSGTIITGSGNGFTCKVYGNIMSLVDEEGFATATTLSVNNTFYRLFYGNTTLTDASGLLLPATELAPSCYNQMFMGCTALTTAPELPATTLGEKCYYRMFYNCNDLTAAPELSATKLAPECYNQMFSSCTSLKAAPELPATELASNCYRSMFMGCTALTTAPVLPATTLVEYCYYQMFTNCTGLTTAPVLPATTLAEYCYYKMFMGCTALTTAPVLPATTLAEYCYYQMFNNCSKLATVTCLATNISANKCISNWLDGAGSAVQGTKTFYKAASMTGWDTNIPSGWTVENAPNN